MQLQVPFKFGGAITFQNRVRIKMVTSKRAADVKGKFCHLVVLRLFVQAPNWILELMAALLGIHSCSLGAPILLEEAKAAGVEPSAKDKVPTPVCDKTRAAGQWNTAWDSFFNLDPLWTEQFVAAGIPVYTGELIAPKLAEFLSIAFDASYTHMYAPGTRRHSKQR